jgi:hypothetical protein
MSRALSLRFSLAVAVVASTAALAWPAGAQTSHAAEARAPRRVGAARTAQVGATITAID